MLDKIISGGQTGADQGGLEAGKILNIKTGGTAPPDFMTEVGSNYLLKNRYKLVEGIYDPKIYPRRTAKNVADSDGTVWFGEINSAGGHLTLRKCKEYRREIIVNPTSEQLKSWIETFNIEILNVAGNRESRNKGIYKIAMDTIVEAFKQMLRIDYF